MGRHFIDRYGACWDDGARQLQERLGARCSSATFEKFIVRNLGFVSVQFGATSCLIKVAPSQLSLDAYMTLSQLLSEVAADRYAVSLFQDGWRDLIFPDCRAVLRHLLQSSDCGRRDHGDPFVTRPKAISKLSSAHPLMDLVDAWRASSGRLDVATCSSLLNERLGGRFVVIEQAPNALGLVFSRIGQGYAMYDPGWPARMTGYPIDCQPDAHYGQWIARCLRSAFEQREPTLNDIDAIVTNPVAQTARRIRYTRLTLPLRRRDGGLQMLSASLVDTGINIGVKLG